MSLHSRLPLVPRGNELCGDIGPTDEGWGDRSIPLQTDRSIDEGDASPGRRRVAIGGLARNPIHRKELSMSVVTILVIIVLILLAIYLFRRIA
jgi:hypothetical protein